MMTSSRVIKDSFGFYWKTAMIKYLRVLLTQGKSELFHVNYRKVTQDVQHDIAGWNIDHSILIPESK